MSWFLLAALCVWLTRLAVSNYPAKLARLLATLGLCLNASVVMANNGSMPVVGMPSTFVAASSLWRPAGIHSHLLFLADHVSIYYFSLGDLFLIGGGLALWFIWLLKILRRFSNMNQLRKLWQEDRGQDIAEYAVLLAVILVIVVGTIRLIGSSANTTFNQVSSSLQ